MKKSLLSILALLAMSAAAQSAPNSAVITFNRPVTYADGSVLDATVAVTYGLYQGVQGQPKTKVATVLTTSSTVNTGLASGSTYCFQVSAIANGIEGDLSLEACKSFPFGKPGVVTITVQ